jgi:rifampicin phosphotransferase
MGSPLAFDVPGPGLWTMDLVHFPRPLSALLREVTRPEAVRGMTWSMERVGTIANPGKAVYVHRYAYFQESHLFEKELTDGISQSQFRALLETDPEALRRSAVTRDFFAKRSWRADEERWRTEIIPQQLATNLEFIEVEPGLLADVQLAEHIDRAVAWMGRCSYVHHILNLVQGVPIGEFIDAVVQLTGADETAALECLRSWSPASRNAAWRELAELTECLGTSPEVLEAIKSGRSDAETLDALRDAADPVGPVATRYVRMAAFRTIGGFDVADVCAFERPEAVLAAVTAALNADPLAAAREREQAEEQAQRLRRQVPESARAGFDERLAEARLVYHIRDERGVYNNLMANAVVRRALLELGARLARRGLLTDAAHAAELSPEEIRLASGEHPAIDGAELADRFQFRHDHDQRDAPATLGSALWQEPPLDWYTGDTQRLMRATARGLQAIRGTPAQEARQGSVRGTAAGKGVYEGVARVIVRAADLEKIQPGEVMVVVATAPAYSAILPLIGAVVTDVGGPLSHAAIVAREYGIPAVVGCGNATSAIATGDRVRVDASNGVVEILGS